MGQAYHLPVIDRRELGREHPGLAVHEGVAVIPHSACPIPPGYGFAAGTKIPWKSPAC